MIYKSETVPVKTTENIEQMRVACRLAADTLDYLEPLIEVGMTTNYLDKLCHEYILDHGAIPAPLNYCPPGHAPYPKATCISVNHQVCHGVPNDDFHLSEGDIFNVDITVIKDGWHGDTGRMFFVGRLPPKTRHLCETARICLWRGIKKVRPGAYLGDIGCAIQQYAEAMGYSVVRDFCGHGLGRHFHEPPQVLHFGKRGEGVILKSGMVFTIEPMINIGRPSVKILSDGWTVVTRDRSLSAQWEHTIRVTDSGYEVLTLSKTERLGDIPIT